MTVNCPKYDFHIHTCHVGCANATMEIPAIVKRCEQMGLTAIAITDHADRPDQLHAHQRIKSELENIDTNIDLYFALEANYVGPNREFVYDEQMKETYGFQFAIGGIHGTFLDEYDPAKIVDVQHRYHLKTCRNALIDVLVHPYWFSLGEFQEKQWPGFDAMPPVPAGYARELGQVAKETNTAIEINACANVSNPTWSDRHIAEYIDYLAVLAEQGAMFAVGSDAHDINSLEKIQSAWTVAEQLGIVPDRIWRPKSAPFNS